MTTVLGGNTGFNEDNFMKKLDNVTPTQDSIQSLALWIIHHKANHDAICRLWLKKLNEASNGKQRLALFYLANDVIQNCRRKNAKIFQDTFKSCLTEAVELVKNDAIKKKIERVFDVWSERNVYDQEFIIKLNETLYKEDSVLVNKQSMLTKSPPPVVKLKPSTLASVQVVQQPNTTIPHSETENKNELEYQKIISEFQPKNLRESINTFYNLQTEVNLSKNNVEATRLLDINVDHIKQYRDKSQCAKFKTEFENSCNKLEEFIRRLTEEAEQRKNLIQLLNQSEIFYDAQFKDATTVFNAYKSFGHKVSTVKRKLDELITNKFNSNDVKLDNLDMEMSEDENEDNDKLKKSSKSYSKHAGSSSKSRSPPHLSTSSSASSSNPIRNNLDPRQNRHSHHHHHSTSSKKTSSASVSSSKTNQTNKNIRKSSHYDDDLYERDRSNTPVKDEHTLVKPIVTPNSNNPLDFLTKFINKSSNQFNEISTPSINSPTTVSSNGNSSSANLSYLVDSLKKFVNTSSSTFNENVNTVSTSASYIPQQTTAQFYDYPLNSQNSFIQQPGTPVILNQQQQQRSATPTKDEIYQQQTLIQTMPPLPPLPPPLPPIPVESIHNQPPGPNSPYLPAPYHPMMYPPNHTNQVIYPMYLQAPPPPPPPQMSMTTSNNMPLMMIDPNNCYQYPSPSTSQSTSKMIISPPLSSASSASSSSSNPTLNQPNSPTNQTQGYWGTVNNPNQFNGFNNGQMDDSLNNSFNNEDNHMRLSSKRNSFNNETPNRMTSNTSNDFNSPYKRKYNSNSNYYDESGDRSHFNKPYSNFNNNNNPSNNPKPHQQQNQSFNRIPTINSQRDRGGNSANFSDNNNNNNPNNYSPPMTYNRGGGSSSSSSNGPKASRF